MPEKRYEVIMSMGTGKDEKAIRGPEIPVAEWTHLHGQWRDGEMEVYVNGE